MHLHRFVEVLLKASNARACYLTRVWTALFFPALVGTVFRFSTRAKLEAFLVSLLIVVVYSAACVLERNYLNVDRSRSAQAPREGRG